MKINVWNASARALRRYSFTLVEGDKKALMDSTEWIKIRSRALEPFRQNKIKLQVNKHKSRKDVEAVIQDFQERVKRNSVGEPTT